MRHNISLIIYENTKALKYRVENAEIERIFIEHVPVLKMIYFYLNIF